MTTYLQTQAALINKYQTAEGNAALIGNETMRKHFRAKWRKIQAHSFSHSVRH